LQADKSFLELLFKRLNNENDEKAGDEDDSDDAKLRRQRDVALFLKEFCLFSHTLPPQNRDAFFKVCSVFLSKLRNY